jgi:hypothetical protein
VRLSGETAGNGRERRERARGMTCLPGKTRRTLAVACALLALLLGVLLAPSASAGWPPPSESDGVYGRLGGNTDASIKLGGLLSQSRFSGSVGASAHYYSLLGITGDYSESLADDARQLRSFSVGTELRPLFLPRWLLGKQRGPAWLDLTLDSVCLGFGAYFGQVAAPGDDTRGVWMSLGLGMPVISRASGPWLEVRALRRWPDSGGERADAHNALLLYLSWHQVVQLGSAH